MYLSFTPTKIQQARRHIEAIGGDTVHSIETNVTVPFRIERVPKFSGHIPGGTRAQTRLKNGQHSLYCFSESPYFPRQPNSTE